MVSDRLLPLVSVCIPTYNRAEKLRRTVEALQRASYGNLEIVISDNGSSDATEATCRALAAGDARIVFHRHPANLGPTRNFNFAKAMAGGKYFLWHGDDDVVEPDYIARCVAELERDPQLILVAGLSSYALPGGGYRRGNVIQPSAPGALARIVDYLLRVNDNSIFCGAYRRELVEDLELPNVLGGDWAWLASVVRRGRARVLPDVLVHRDHGDTTSASYSRICRVFGLPQRHARYYPLYMAINVARTMVLTDRDGAHAGLLPRVVERLLIGLIVLVKFPLARAPRLRRLVRRLVPGRGSR